MSDFKWVIRHLTPRSILIYHPNEVNISYKRPRQLHFKIFILNIFRKEKAVLSVQKTYALCQSQIALCGCPVFSMLKHEKKGAKLSPVSLILFF